MTNLHEFYLNKAVRLAKKGIGKVTPNPLVGAVIVKKGKIIGGGFHEKYGEAHAEINALKKCIENPRGADLYVNLEPCCHSGKTEPCTTKIINSGIRRVFFCINDPNPLMNGKSASVLQKAGIQVFSGFLEKSACKLNEIFLKNIIQKQPFIALKIAMTLDGKIALSGGESKWITSVKSRTHVHALRNKYDAVLVGINTILKDDPHLTVRHIKGRDPIRIILDPMLKIDPYAKVLQDSNVILCTQKKEMLFLSAQKRFEYLKTQGISFIHCAKYIDLNDLLNALYKRNICSVLVEGGRYTFTEFIKQQLFNKIYAFIAPKFIGGKNSISALGDLKINKLSNAENLKFDTIKRMGEDIMIEAYPK